MDTNRRGIQQWVIQKRPMIANLAKCIKTNCSKYCEIVLSDRMCVHTKALWTGVRTLACAPPLNQPARPIHNGRRSPAIFGLFFNVHDGSDRTITQSLAQFISMLIGKLGCCLQGPASSRKAKNLVMEGLVMASAACKCNSPTFYW
jgi:hypothetical protein